MGVGLETNSFFSADFRILIFPIFQVTVADSTDSGSETDDEAGGPDDELLGKVRLAQGILKGEVSLYH